MTAIHTTLKRVHYVAPYLRDPANPITVNVIGAGGTGSSMLTQLCQLNHSLRELNHPGLQVNLWDPDTISQANRGRQLFASVEVGLNKAVALINRANRFYGTNWKAIPRRYALVGMKSSANFTISCVDTVAARLEIASVLREVAATKEGVYQPYYWLDFGNSKSTGQMMLATVRSIKQPTSEEFETVGNLPFITDEYGDELHASEKDSNLPSCSLAEALTKQDLFINPCLATHGAAFLWNMLKQGILEYRGFFLNLSDFRTQPVKV
jgi:PRTRC genetic system ThiF family protein